MKLSFLGSAHGTPAVKAFTKKGIQSYPRIKMWNSKSYEIEISNAGLRQKAELIREHAARGDCMLKNHLNQELSDQSRAGMVDKEAMTQTLLLDIDGITIPKVSIPLPLDKPAIELLAEKVITLLPEAFAGVSYIVHASSSMGMKGNRICLHMDFALQDEVSPRALKEYIVHMNHACVIFEENFALAASGTALKFPLDRTVCDNSHLIYLGTPVFYDGLEDPIANPEDRTFLVEKDACSLNLADEIKNNSDTTQNGKDNKRKVKELRSLAGLPDRREKTSTMRLGGHTIHVVTNPESIAMSFAADNGDWVAYNVNGGDSAGYFVPKYQPQVVRNFKGEPNFLFEAADPNTYQWHLENFIGGGNVPDGNTDTDVPDDVPPMPLVFRDAASNSYYNALVSTSTGMLREIYKSSRDALEDWMVQYEGVMPVNVPNWSYRFEPQNTEVVDFQNNFINKYIPSEYMRTTFSMPDDYAPLDYDSSIELRRWCPIIAELILHATGRDTDMFMHFLNWLAGALQTRDKLGVAWILQGTQGTGKGVLFENVITPLVGHGQDETMPYATKIRIENLEDQFNQWVECSLFTAIDEFRIEDSAKSKRLFNKIKSMITEPFEPLRGMRENLRNVRSYTNYIFLSNDLDVMFMPEDDRRFNVCRRQEKKLTEIWPDMDPIIHGAIPNELPMFAQIMKDFMVDMKQARTVIENDAKKAMRTVSRTSIEDFVNALRGGDIEFFLPILDMPYSAPGTSYVVPAQTMLKGVLRDMDRTLDHKLTTEEARILYNSFIGHSDNGRKFGKLMGRHGLVSSKHRINGKIQVGYAVQWNLRLNDLKTLQDLHLSETDKQFGSHKVSIVK